MQVISYGDVQNVRNPYSRNFSERPISIPKGKQV